MLQYPEQHQQQELLPHMLPDYVKLHTKNQHVLVYETNDATVSVAEGAQPYMVTFNTPSWVQGSTNNNNIKYTFLIFSNFLQKYHIFLSFGATFLHVHAS